MQKPRARTVATTMRTVRSSESAHVPLSRLPQPGQLQVQSTMPPHPAQALHQPTGRHTHLPLPPLGAMVPAHLQAARRKGPTGPPPRRIVPDTEARRNVDAFLPAKRRKTAPLPPLVRLAPRKPPGVPLQNADTGHGMLQTQPFASLPTSSAPAAQAPAQVNPPPASQAAIQPNRHVSPSPPQQTTMPRSPPATNQPRKPLPPRPVTAQGRPQRQQPTSALAPEPVMGPPFAGQDKVDDTTSTLGGFTYTPGTYTTDYSALGAPLPWLHKSRAAPRAPPLPSASIPLPPPTPYGPQQYTYIAPPMAQVQPYTMVSQQFPVLEQQYMQSPENTASDLCSRDSVDVQLDKLLVSIIDGSD